MSAVPEDVRDLVQVVAVKVWMTMRGTSVSLSKAEEMACAAVMADRAARPSAPPVPNVREENDKFVEALTRDLIHCVHGSAQNDVTRRTMWQLIGALNDRAAERQRLRAETEASR